MGGADSFLSKSAAGTACCVVFLCEAALYTCAPRLSASPVFSSQLGNRGVNVSPPVRQQELIVREKQMARRRFDMKKVKTVSSGGETFFSLSWRGQRQLSEVASVGGETL